MAIQPPESTSNLGQAAKAVGAGGLIFVVVLAMGGLLGWCGGVRPGPDAPGQVPEHVKEAQDPGYDKLPDGVQVPNRRGPYDYESRDGGEP